MTPAQHLRKVLEHEATYDGAVASLQTTPQIDENYFIVSGAAAAQGVVIARGELLLPRDRLLPYEGCSGVRVSQGLVKGSSRVRQGFVKG